MTSDNERDLLASFDERWDNYRKQFKASRREISEDAVHDLRVSARRMQAMLGIARKLDARPRVKKLERFLRKQLDELDGLRDTHVLVQEANQNIGSLPHLIPFRDHLEERSQELARSGRKDLQKHKPSDFGKRIRKIRKVVKQHSKDPDIVEQLFQAVDEAYAKVGTRFGKLDAGEQNTIHRMRIAFKKLRYMIEAVQPFLPHYPEGHLDKMHDYQDAMGKVHDTAVFLDALQDFELHLQQQDPDKAEDTDLKPAEQFFRTRLAELILGYFQRKDELYTFWRAAPNQPFPWENSHDALHRTARNRRRSGSQQQRATGQPAAAHRRGTKEVREDRAGAGQHGNADRPDTDQSVPTGS